jgi:hypothetical protein
MSNAMRAVGTFEDEARRLRALRDKKDELAADFKTAEEEYKEQEQIVLDLMIEQGISSTKIPGVATLTKTESVVPVAEDWGAIYGFIENNAMPHILQRRLSSTAIDELAAQGTVVPGVGSFKKIALSMRKA